MNGTPTVIRARTAHPTALLIGATVVYYALDLVKDLYLYGRFGPGQLDPYYASYTLLDAVVKATMFSALGAALMPVLAAAAREGGDELAERLGSTVLLLSAVVLSGLTVAGVCFAPQVLSIYGFPATRSSVLIARLVFAGLPLFGIDKIGRTLLEQRQQFGPPSAAALIFRVVFLVVVIALAARLEVVGAGVASVAAAAAAAVFVVAAFFASGARLRRPLALAHPLLRRTGLLLVPLGVAGIFTQSSLVDRLFASHFEAGSLSLLRLAWVLYDIPITLFCVSIGTAVFPRMCDAAAADDRPALQRHLATGLRRAEYFVLPAMFGLIALAHPLIQTLYQRGEFTAQDAGRAAGVLSIYCVGLAAAAMRPLLARAVYAVGQHKWFLPLEVMTLALNVALNYLFAIVLGWGLPGLALSTTVAVTAAAAAQWWLVKRFIGLAELRGLIGGLIRMAGAAVLMGIICYTLWHIPGPPGGRLAALVRLAAVILVGAGAYFVMTAALRIEEFKHLRELFDKFVRRRHD